MNMNVLDKGVVPKVKNLKEVLQVWLSTVRMSCSPFLHRLEKNNVLRVHGYLIVYLNIDEVIRIIREEDEPKESLMQSSN